MTVLTSLLRHIESMTEAEQMALWQTLSETVEPIKPSPSPTPSLAEYNQLTARLQRQEDLNQKFRESLLDAFYLLESVRDEAGEIVDFCIIDLNDKAVQQMSLPRESLLGGYICELFPVNRTNGFFEQYKQVALTGEPLLQEYMIPMEHAAPGWYFHQVVKVDDGVAIVNQDITLRKQMETALRERYAELDHFFTAALELLCIADLNGRFVRVNDEWEQVLGYTREELEGHSFLSLVHPDDMAETLAAIEQLSEAEPVLNFTNRYRTKDGAYRFIEWRSALRGGLIYAAARDITEWQVREAALRQTTTRLRQALAMGQMGYWLWGVESERTIWSEECYALFGVPDMARDVPVEQVFHTAVHPDDYAAEQQAIAEVMAGGVYDWEYRFFYPDGSLHYMHAVAQLVRDAEGEPKAIAGIVQNVTRQKQTELSLQKLTNQLQKAQQIGAMGSWEWDVVTNEVKWSAQMYRLFGLPVDGVEATRDNFRTAVHPADQNLADQALRRVQAGANDYDFQYRITHPNGQLHYLHSRAECVRDEEGNLTRLVGITQDITARREAELAQQASEAQFRTLVSNIPGITYRCVVDESWTMIFMSEAVQDVTGYPASDFLHNQQRTFASIIHPADRKRVYDTVQEALRHCPDGVGHFELEYRLIHADHEVRWVREHGRGIHDDNGQLSYLDGVILDITQQKQLDEQQRAMLAAIPDMLFRLHVADERFLDYHAPQEAALMLPPAEFLGHTIYETLPPALAEELHTAMLQVQQTDEIQKLEYSLELSPRQPSYYEGRVAPINEAEQLLLVRDITAEKEAREERERFLQDMKSLQMIYLELGRIEELETLYEQMVVFSQEALGLDRLALFIVDEEQNVVRGTYGIDTHGRVRNERHYIEPITPNHWSNAIFQAPNHTIHWSEAPLYDNGQIIGTGWKVGSALWTGRKAIGYLICDNYLTQQPIRPYQLELCSLLGNSFGHLLERKQNELALSIARDQAIEASQYKSHLLSKVSHELRTPLTGIIGYAELLADSSSYFLTAEIKQHYIKQITHSAYHLNEMINDLLDQSQIAQGKLKIITNPFVLSSMTHFLQELLSPIATQKGLTFTLYCDPDLPEIIIGDEKRLRQIIINLVNNGLKFTDEGSVKVNLERVGDAHWAIHVQDTGSGIPVDAQNRIFESFWQVPGTTQKGYGLGLSIVNSLVQAMHGRVSVESTLGQGSTFSIWLPLNSQ